MDIKSLFLSSLVSYPRLSPGQSPGDFLGRTFSPQEENASPLLHLLSFGNIKAVSPWAFDVNPMDFHMLLFTQKGCGKLTVNNQVFSLTEGSLLFLDCRQRFRIDIAVAPWEYQIAFLGGSTLPYYSSLLPNGLIPVIPVPPYSDLSMSLELLSSKTPDCRTDTKLIISDLLSHIITGCILEALKEKEPFPQVPSYIREMKKFFDENFSEAYTLDILEEHFGINKYRLCREFGKAYKTPPLQYLNRKRIDYAAHLLLTTSRKIHEVGSMVGIDNTNHFISLFKKYLGTTPLEYRRRMT